MAATATNFDAYGSWDAGVAIPLRDIIPWAVFATVIAMVLLYFVSTEQGAMSLFSGMYVHEFVHDGRHLLGFPCH